MIWRCYHFYLAFTGNNFKKNDLISGQYIARVRVHKSIFTHIQVMGKVNDSQENQQIILDRQEIEKEERKRQTDRQTQIERYERGERGKENG